MKLDDFETLARSRRAVRHFRPDPIPEGLLNRLLDVAHWSPSGWNLQPTHFVVVADPALKSALCAACLGQPQVKEAPATVVFTGDRHVVRNHLEQVLRLEREAGAVSEAYERRVRGFIELAFETGPLGLGWLWKAMAPSLAGLVRPVPSLPAVHRRFWLAKQVMLAAMTFMLAASAAGLATVPMEGFDEQRVKRVLKIPRWHIVPLVVPVGYAADSELVKTRLPVEQLIHRDGW